MTTKHRPLYLTREARAALVRETFDAIATVGFLKWRAEERKLGVSVNEQDRQAYMEHFRQSYQPEFQAMAAKATNDRLYGLLEDYTEQANAMGLEEWKREQQAKPRNRGPELER
ncbi:MAG TPA: hypothetical protein VEL76_23385 [Gemmataceae bacterium]|nr:hypothetical protein [Gemmataceae bacterium]